MKQITVVFRNSIQVDGSLLSINDNEMVIKSTDELTDIVIPDVKENVLFYKVSSAKEEHQELSSEPIRTDDGLKRLAEVKGKMNELEKQSVREQLLQNIHIKKEPNVNYQIQSAIQYTEEKAPRTDHSFTTGLQGVFVKKYH